MALFKRLPLFKLLVLAEIALLARNHLYRLDRDERHRLFYLVRKARGTRTRLTEDERDELADLVAKADPRLFAGLAVDRLSPVPLPRRFVHGPAKRG